MIPSTAIYHLNKFFSKSSTNSVTIEEIFHIYGRENHSTVVNKSWLANKLTPMYKYGLLKPLYEANRSPKKLIALQITDRGKKAIENLSSETELVNMSQPASSIINHSSYFLQGYLDSAVSVSIHKVIQDIKKLREQYPEFEITFDMKLKNI